MKDFNCKALHKQICFSWFWRIVNNKPPSITPESLLCASVKLFIIIQLSDYVCPFVYLSTSERQKVLKHLQTRQLIYFHIICPPILHIIICNQSPKLQDAPTFYIPEWPITSAVRRISIEHWYSCLDMNTLCLCRYRSPQKETLFPEYWIKQKTHQSCLQGAWAWLIRELYKSPAATCQLHSETFSWFQLQIMTFLQPSPFFIFC